MSLYVKRKALCIGTQYLNHPHVNPVHLDAKGLADLLKDRFKYEVEILLDDGTGPQPTKNNIYEAIMRLRENTGAGDHLFIHFSGHGTQITNQDGTEDDGLDEVILPVDCKRNPAISDDGDRRYWDRDSIIIDDDLHEWIMKFTPNTYVTVLFDACHSGTALDLKFSRWYGERKTDQEIERPKVGRRSSLVLNEVCNSLVQVKRDGPIIEYWSACADSMESIGCATSGGLMVRNFIERIKNSERMPTHRELLVFLHDKIGKKICMINRKYQEPPIGVQEPWFSSNLLRVLIKGCRHHYPTIFLSQ
ncbi:peptidase C14 [Ramaria rubella]|nr:peptidase C14 [Ramaria rubella]